MADETGKHNLEWAISTGRLQQVKYLLSERNGPVQLSTNGINPLEVALRIDDDLRRKRVFNYLLQRGADVTKKDAVTGRDVFSWACLLGREEQVRRLLMVAPGEFSFRQADKTGMMPIHYSVRGANPIVVYQVVTEMKKFGVNIDVPNSQDGLTALLMAKRLGYELTSQILLTEGKACPSQFDTKTFRTKTRWSEVGSDERNKADLQSMITELRINGSTRPHTSYQVRRDQALERTAPEPKRLPPGTTGVQTRSSTARQSSAGPNFSYTPNYALPQQELHRELQLSDLKQICDGRASLADIKKFHNTEGDSGIQSSNTSGNISRYSKGSNTPNEKHTSWTKLNNLLSLSDRSSVLSSDRFARSVSVSGASETRPNPDAGNLQESYNPTLIHSMMTAVSNQMSTSFRKPAVARPKPEPKREPKKKKKGSTLAFILSSQPGQKQRRPSRVYNTRSTAKSRTQRSAQVTEAQPRSRRPNHVSRGYTFGHRSSIRNPSAHQLPAINISS